MHRNRQVKRRPRATNAQERGERPGERDKTAAKCGRMPTALSPRGIDVPSRLRRAHVARDGANVAHSGGLLCWFDRSECRPGRQLRRGLAAARWVASLGMGVGLFLGKSGVGATLATYCGTSRESRPATQSLRRRVPGRGPIPMQGRNTEPTSLAGTAISPFAKQLRCLARAGSSGLTETPATTRALYHILVLSGVLRLGVDHGLQESLQKTIQGFASGLAWVRCKLVL
jgi:hypothetical protein